MLRQLHKVTIALVVDVTEVNNKAGTINLQSGKVQG